MAKVLYLNNFRGGTKMNVEALVKFAKAVLYFVNHSDKPIYRTKLNKLLFYAQFYHYKNYQEELLSETFVKDFYGPVIQDLDRRLSVLVDAGLLELKEVGFGTTIHPKVSLSNDIYNREELDTLNHVNSYFSDFSAREISDYSHNEPLWSNVALKEVISLSKADLLKGI